MTCENCIKASKEIWAGFSSGCAQCQARAVSRGPDYFNSKAEGRLSTEYLRLLTRARLTHDQVKAAAAVDVQGRAHDTTEL